MWAEKGEFIYGKARIIISVFWILSYTLEKYLNDWMASIMIQKFQSYLFLASKLNIF